MAPVNPYKGYLEKQMPAVIGFIRELVECESPSDSPDGVNRLVEVLMERTRDIAEAAPMEAPGFGRHLRLEFRTAGRERAVGQILGLGHSDTVWAEGTLREMPFREADGRLWGPGVLDMKAGMVIFIYAVRALIELGIPAKHRIVLLVVSDEEVGSPSSRPVTEKEAAQSEFVLVLEPGTGLEGKLKTARKGIAHYELTVKGRAAHAGVDFDKGASAIVEMARQIPVLADMTDPERGTTVNPGVIRGGTRSNVVAPEAKLEIDVRVRTMAEWEAVDGRLRSLTPVDSRCEISIAGGLNRPPMVRSERIGELFRQAQRIGESMGVVLEESETGGGSDGNFTAALGIPTLDGLGAVGEGAHARHESIVTDRIWERICVLAGILGDSG